MRRWIQSTPLKEAASNKSYKGVLEYSDEPLVSQDIVGNPHSCIFDSKLTLNAGQPLREVVGWYDTNGVTVIVAWSCCRCWEIATLAHTHDRAMKTYFDHELLMYIRKQLPFAAGSGTY